MYAYQLAPGYQSPSDIDADGFCAVDDIPIDDYKGWVIEKAIYENRILNLVRDRN